jgi:tape measure domain-containing protein
MSGSRPTVGIRISAEGADLARAKIEAVGTSGEAAMRRVASASALAGPEMQKLGTSIDVVQRAFVGMGGSLGRVGSVATGVAGVAGVLATGFLALGAAATVAGVGIAKAGDEANATLARLASATGGLAQAEAVYGRLFQLSQQTGISVTESAGSFARFSVAAKEIGATSDQVLRLTAGIQKAGIVAGASAQETGAAVQQIGQALASGKLQGDELRSLLENLPQLAQALARELNVSVGQLRQMGSEGKLTAETVFPALLRASEKMGAEFDKMPVTMSRAKDILIAATEDFAQRLDRVTGLSRAFAGFMQTGAAALRAAGTAIAPSEREAVDQGVAAAERRAAQVRAQVAAERAASAYGDISPGLKQAEEIAAQDLQAALARQNDIRRGDRELQRAEAEDAAAQARAAASTAATLRLKDTAADLFAAFKARKEYADKIKKIDEDEARSGVLPEGVSFGGLRAAAAKELEEALEKAAKSAEKVADGHKRIGKEADDAAAHVKANMKDQEKAAEAVAKAQQKAAEEIERFHTRSFDAVASIGERAFDRVGDALVQAFVSGEGAAVNFGGVLRGVISSALTDVAKLAVVNPILNSLFTSTSGARPTLAGAFGGGATEVGGFGSLGSLGGIGKYLSGGLDTLSSGGYFASGGGGLFGSVDAMGSATSGLLGSGGEFSLGSLGSTLGGVGAGFGIGSTLGGFIANSSAQRQNSQIGSALGSLIGSIGGPLGSIIGGTLGGSLGGLIGPKDSVKGYGLRLQSAGFVPDGANDFSGSLRPVDRTYFNESGAAQFQQADQLVAAVNAYLAANNLQVAGAGVVSGNKNGPDGKGFATVGEAFGNLAFRSSDNAGLSRYLSGQAFDDPAKLQAAVDGFKQADAAIKALGVEAVPAFTASLKAVNDNFDAGLEAARKYGLAEDTLTTARGKALQALEAQRTEALLQSGASIAIRRLAAGGDSQSADLARQAEAARIEVDAFGKSLDALAVSAADKGQRLLELEEVQAAERAAIIARYGEQAAQALRQAGGNIRAYLDSLAAGTAAGASPTDRLTAAQSAFDRDRVLATGGDRDALGRITGSADALLSAGRDVYASGAGFQSIRGAVTTGLSALPVVQSYDAQQAASLTAIQAALTTGTLNTATTILTTGNTVQIAGGVSSAGVETRLSLMIEQNQTAAVSRAAQHATAVNQEGALYALGLIGNATNDNLALTNTIAADASAASVTGLAALTTVAVDASAASVTGLAALTTVAVDASAASVTGLAALTTVSVDASAANIAALNASNTIAASNANATVAALNAGNTISASNASAFVAALNANNVITADGNSRLATINAYASFIDNTGKAQNNYILELRDEMRGLRQQVNELKAALQGVTAAVQQGAVLTAAEARNAGALVSDAVIEVNDTLRKAAA